MMRVYGREGCAPCKMVRLLLDKMQVAYEYLPAEGQEYEELANKFGFMVPLVVKGEEGFCGYYPQRINELV